MTDFLIAPDGFRIAVKAGTASLAVAALLALAIQTFTEELLFRGYITQGLLLATKNPLAASALSAVFFGALHIPNGLPQAVLGTFFGFVCSLIAMRTAGLAFTAGLHLANNFFGAVVVVSSDDVFKGTPGLFTQTTPHLVWWDVAFTIVALFATLCLTIGRFPVSKKLAICRKKEAKGRCGPTRVPRCGRASDAAIVWRMFAMIFAIFSASPCTDSRFSTCLWLRTVETSRHSTTIPKR